MTRRTLLAIAAAAVAVGCSVAPAGAIPPPGAPSCPVFPSNNVWHANISKLPVNRHSAAWLASMSAASKHLHPDFGPSGESMPYGIPYIVVPSSHQKVSVSFDYADESDPGPYPFGSDTPIEGGSSSSGDRHAIMIDSGTCKLYELYDAHYSSGGSTAGSGAIWSLKSNALRPAGWTSADAAGLPIFAGLVRLDEVKKGVVDHAIRFTASSTDRTYLWPARHQAGAARNANLPPMGARFRLKSSFSLSGYRSDTKVILTAMKRYGMIAADNGSDWYFQGTAEDGWSNAMLDELKSIPASAFEAVDESSLMMSSNSGQVRTTTPTTTHTTTKKTTPKPASTQRPAPKPSPSRSPSASPSASVSPSATASPSATPSVAVAAAPSRGDGGGAWKIALVGGVCACLAAGILLTRRRRGAAGEPGNAADHR